MTGVERKIVFALASMAVWGVALPGMTEAADMPLMGESRGAIVTGNEDGAGNTTGIAAS